MRIYAERIRHFWRRIACAPFAHLLETEVARLTAENSRLRGENRALLNSILGIAGIPPVYSNSAEEPRNLLSPRAGPEAPALGPVSPSDNHRSATGASHIGSPAERWKNPTQVAGPLRRRSWHQINRTLEFKAAHKGAQESSGK